MNTRPRVSVVITCFNYGRFLQESVESALFQSFVDLEVLIIDDGSTDNTSAVVRRWTGKKQFRYIRQENAGQAAAKNLGIRESRGEFVAFLDADDRWDKHKLEKQIERFSDRQVGVVYSRVFRMKPDGTDPYNPVRRGHLVPRRGSVTKYLIFDNFVPFSSAVVRRQCLEKVGGFDETLRMSIDWDLWLRISVSYDFDYVNEPLAYYRVGHAGQMSRNAMIRQDSCDRISDRFRMSYPGIVPKVVWRQSDAYTAALRGEYWEACDPCKALAFYRKSVVHYPFQLMANLRMVRTAARHFMSPRS